MKTKTVTLLICGLALAATIVSLLTSPGVVDSSQAGSSSTDWWEHPDFDEPGWGDVIDPQDYVSVSGQFSLHVEPTQRLGVGPTSYRMTQNGQTLWAKKLPYTLADAVVTDDGVTAGYSYSHGTNGIVDRNSDNQMRVVVLGPAGEQRLGETTPRKSSWYHAPDTPRVAGMMVTAGADRVVFRIPDENWDRGEEQWWTYRLSTGELVGKFVPKRQLKDPGEWCRLNKALPVPSTDVTLVQWHTRNGTRFTLVTEDTSVVWELNMPTDYSVSGDEEAEDRLRDLIRENSAVLKVDTPREFELFFAKDRQRVRFSVNETNGKFAVTETARSPVTLADLTSTPPTPTIPAVSELTLLGTIELVPAQSELPIRDVWDFVFDGAGNIAFIRGTKSPSFVLVNDSGTVLSELVLPSSDEERSGWHLCWLAGQRFIAVQSGYGETAQSEACWIDTGAGTVSAIKKLEVPPIEHLDRLPNGDLVALTRLHEKYTISDAFYCFDPEGRIKQSRKHDFGSFGKGLAVIGDRVALVRTIDKEIGYVDSRGNRTGPTIDLVSAMGRDPNYLSDIESCQGNLIVHDFNGTPSYVVMTTSGEVLNEFSPRFPDGRLVGEVEFGAAPDGRVWVSDCYALMRLNAKGVVDRVLGKQANEIQLSRIAASKVGVDGTIYATDSRTAVTSVFDSQGNFLCACKPAVDDTAGTINFPDLSVGKSEVLVQTSDEAYVFFDLTGRRTGTVPASGVAISLYLQPRTGNRIMVSSDNVFLVDSENKLLRKIAKLHDGRWIDWPKNLSFDTDGSFAITAGRNQTPEVVNFYTADGDSIGMFEVPTFLQTHPNIAYGAGRVVMASHEEYLAVFDTKGQLLKLAKGKWAYFCQPHITADGKEILIVPSEGTTLRRYAMP